MPGRGVVDHGALEHAAQTGRDYRARAVGRLRSPYDREIVRLALPALGALAAEPLYILVDTAIVGHLGRSQLAALGLAGTVLAGAFTMFNFLTYGTTAVVARASGAGEHERAARLAAQALWVSLGIGLLLLVICEALAGPLLRALGADGKSGDYAVTYFRIAAIGLPAALVALAGQGYLRGVSNMRRPLEVVVVANIVNLVLEVLFVYGFHWGIAGSAAGTAIAQIGMGVAFAGRVAASTRRLEAAEPPGNATDDARRQADLRADGRPVCVVSRGSVGLCPDGRSAARGASDRVAAFLLSRARPGLGCDRRPGDRRAHARRG